MAAGWNITRTALRPLNRAGLLAFGMRCAMRVDALVLPQVRPAWEAALGEVAAAREAPTPTAATTARHLSDLGAIGSYDAAGTGGEVRGRAGSQSGQSLVVLLQASAQEDRGALVSGVIGCAAQARSAVAGLAHAGLLQTPDGADPLEHALSRHHTATLADIPVVTMDQDAWRTTSDVVDLGPIEGRPLLAAPA